MKCFDNAIKFITETLNTENVYQFHNICGYVDFFQDLTKEEEELIMKSLDKICGKFFYITITHSYTWYLSGRILFHKKSEGKISRIAGTTSNNYGADCNYEEEANNYVSNSIVEPC